jgi:DNA-binding MarR family transcriptional regulator
MAENQNTLSNELLDQLQKIPYLLRRAHYGAKHRMFQDEARQDEHWHAHHHGCPDGMGGHGRDGRNRADWHSGRDGIDAHSDHGRDNGVDSHDRASSRGRGDDRGRGDRGNWHGHADGKPFGARGQGKLLRMLLEHDGILMKDIVEELDIRPSSASELVAKLEKRGFIRTETDAQDKRAKRVYATEKALQYADRLKTAHSEMTTEVFAALTDEEQAQLLTLLRKVTDSMTSRESEAGNLL